MDVPGRRISCEAGSEEYIEIPCKPCEEDGKHTAANGMCKECEENMCTTCFRHHRKGKFCKDHALLDHESSGSIPKEADALDKRLGKCQQHLKELIKFYCPTHEQVGCGDCIILEHKTCKVEYIPDKAMVFKDSKDFETVVNDVRSCSSQSQECLSAIKTKRNVAEVVHAKLIADAEAFRDEIVDHVNKLTADICDQATNIRSKNIEVINMQEKDVSDICHEISTMEETIESQKEQPNELFVTSVQVKKKLINIRKKIAESENRGKAEEYMFQRDYQIESTMVNCNAIGLIQPCHGNELIMGANHEEVPLIPENEIKQAADNMPIAQPLLDRKLRADNIRIAADCLSFASHNAMGDLNGVYIGDIKMTSGCYFEVEIIRSGGNDGSIGIGLVCKDYPEKDFPGWRECSAGYHSDDGRVFIESEFGEPFGPSCGDNDTMGCGVAKTTTLGAYVFFTKNGRKIGERVLRTRKTLYPAVALDTFGQKVKVVLEANVPDA